MLIAALVLILQVHNDLPIARPSETVEIAAAALQPLGDLARVHVFDGERELLAQTLDIDGTRSLLFQTDLPANGKHSFELSAGAPRTYVAILSKFSKSRTVPGMVHFCEVEFTVMSGPIYG